MGKGQKAEGRGQKAQEILLPSAPCSLSTKASPYSSEIALAGLILAGGQSSRMGQDKALVEWQGVPLLLRVCQAAAVCCDRLYILTPWPERYRPMLPEQSIFLTETLQNQGPLVALSQGLPQIDQDWVLLLGCDLPCLDPAVIQTWAGQLVDLPDSVVAYVPRTDYWQPLCGFYRRAAQPQLQAFMEAGGRSLQAWLAEVNTQAIKVTPAIAPMLRNCNTPADLI
jgi:molybdenum cofactor guanylyltransferase